MAEVGVGSWYSGAHCSTPCVALKLGGCIFWAARWSTGFLPLRSFTRRRKMRQPGVERGQGESESTMLGFNLSWDTVSPTRVFPLPYLAATS